MTLFKTASFLRARSFLALLALAAASDVALLTPASSFCTVCFCA